MASKLAMLITNGNVATALVSTSGVVATDEWIAEIVVTNSNVHLKVSRY